MTPILYSFRRCPYAMRARMALHMAGIEVEHREILLRDKPQAMLDASPKGSVPVLVADAGVFDESLDIADWALSQNDPENWRLADYKVWTDIIDGPFKYHLDRYKYASRYEDVPRGALNLDHRSAAVESLKPFETQLARTDNLAGEHPSFADIATFPFIRQFAAVEPDWFSQTCPALRKWLTNWVESALFKTIMVKHPLWQS